MTAIKPATPAAVLEPAGSLVEALARVQAVIPHVLKGKSASIPGKDGRSGYSYKYADLADVTSAILPLLGANGLAFIVRPTTAPDGRFVLEYALKHGVSGQEEAGTYPLPNPVSTNPQQLGSAITYARRYVLCCVTGVVPDEDDDGAAAQQGPAADAAPPPMPSPAELARDAVVRLKAYTGPVDVLDRVLAHALDNGYAREVVTVTTADGSTRCAFARAVELKRQQLEERIADLEAATVQLAAEASQDPAPASQPPPEPAAPEPPAQPAPQGPSHAEDVVSFAVTVDDADVIRDLYRENKAHLGDVVDVPTGVPSHDGRAQLGAILMALAKRLTDDPAAGPLELPGPPVPADGWPDQPDQHPDELPL